MKHFRFTLMLFWLPLLALAGWMYYPYVFDGPVICLWRNLVGQECWGCGMTRAFCSLMRGHPAEAALFNPLVFPVLGALACVYVSGIWSGCIHRRPGGRNHARRSGG